MSKYSSASLSILVDGYDLSPTLMETLARFTECVTQDTMGYGMTYMRATPTGIVKSGLTVGGGIFDEAVDPLHHGTASGGVGVSRIVCVTNEGQSKGAHFTGYEGAYSQKTEVLATNGAFTKANVAYLVSGQVDEGVILQELAEKTADWTTATSDAVDEADRSSNRRISIVAVSEASPSEITTTADHGLTSNDVVAIFNQGGITGTVCTPDINDNPTAAEAWKLIGHTITVTGTKTFTIPVNVTDNGTGSGGYCVVVQHAGGGYGYQQVAGGTGFTAFVGKIRHSVDNSTWADLITFVDTATDFSNAQRVATATTTTAVRRYLAFAGDATGSGHVDIFAGFSRGA